MFLYIPSCFKTDKYSVCVSFVKYGFLLKPVETAGSWRCRASAVLVVWCSRSQYSEFDRVVLLSRGVPGNLPDAAIIGIYGNQAWSLFCF